jgi:hypothetical protein
LIVTGPSIVSIDNGRVVFLLSKLSSQPEVVPNDGRAKRPLRKYSWLARNQENPIDKRRLRHMRLTIVCLIASVLLPSVSRAQGPVFTVTPEESDVKFFVKASVAIEGQFSKWEDSTKVTQTGPNTFDVLGTFTIRGVSKPETLNLTLTGKGTGEGTIKGTMAFDRKEFGMNSGIPFIKIADRVEVAVALKGHKVSGPPLVFKE